jgi:hypothetical protein
VNFAPNVTSFGTGTYTVTRRNASTVDVNGYAVQATASTFTINAAIQMADGRDLQRLPEGMRVTERRKAYTTVRLRVANDPDVISIDGDSWEVEHEERFDLGSYFKYIVGKVGS